MSFLLDTDTCSAWLRRPEQLGQRFIQYGGNLSTSAVNLAELSVLAYLQNDPQRVLDRIKDLLLEVRVLPFDESCAEQYGRLRAELIRAGVGVSGPDLLIAATAMAHGLTVVTHNTKHFDKIPGLPIVDWLTDG